MKINTMAELRAAIIKEKKGVTIEDIALSKSFKKFILSGVEALFKIYNMINPINFKVIYQPDNDLTGCTDNVECVINAGHPLFIKNKKGDFVSVPTAYNRILGVLFHEMGHILYTDSNYRAIEANAIHNEGEFLRPKNMPEEYEDNYIAIKELSKTNILFRKLICQLIMTYSNILEDGRIENKLLTECASASGFCKGLKNLREFQFEDIDFEKELVEFRSEGAFDFQLLPNFLLWFAKFNCKHNTYVDGSFELFEKAIPYVEDYMEKGKSSRDLYDDVRNIIIISWDYGLSDIVKQLEEASNSEGSGDGNGNADGDNPSEGDKSQNLNGSTNNSQSDEGNENEESTSNSGSGSCSEELENEDSSNDGSSTDESGNEEEKSDSDKNSDDSFGSLEENSEPLTTEDIKNIIEDIIKSLEEAKQTEDTGYEGSGDANKKPANNTPSMKDDSLNKIINDVASEKVENQINDSMREEIREIIRSRSYPNKRIHIFSNEEIENINFYRGLPDEKEIRNELHIPVRKTAREINRHIVSDQRTGKAISFTGPRFKASKTYKGDYKYFEKRGNKIDTKKLAVAVRVDESGSMDSYKRYQYARNAAAMLYMLSEEVETLDIAIYGDTVIGYDSFVSIPYCDFGVKSKNVMKLLSKMCPKSGNDDALALKLLGEKLLKQDADERLLISISDGLPTECTSEELKNTVSEYVRKGVNVIAMAIGDDKENIAELYGRDRFCNIENLEDLPKVLTNLIKRKL